ncbi:MAG: helix-turn-helix domain-containing protein, partial [Gammaproteobacteria bacterium]|nr:helix-turn-helix domain-containing protein [Gammaproteobacteria bacterium]
MADSERELTREIGQRVRAARHERGLSLAQLAALTDGLYSKSRISNYEQGLRRPSIEAARTLADALVIVSAAQLLGVEGGEDNALSAGEMRL